MTDASSTARPGARSQATYQVRLGWGLAGLTQLANAGIVIVVDAIDVIDAGDQNLVEAIASEAAAATDSSTIADASSELIASAAAALPHGPTVFRASLRNATATAHAAYEEQVARGGRTAINLVLVGDEDGSFAVEDYLAAGAIGDALSALGIDHSAPDVAVATEGFRPLTRALKHLLSASASGLSLAEAGHRDEVKAAAELDAEPAAIRFAN